MDFTKIKQTLSPYIEKGKQLGEKAIDFTGKQISGTPLFLKSEEEYNILCSAKRSILVAFDKQEATIKNMMFSFPIWSTKAWTDMAEMRYLAIDENPDLAKTLGIIGPVEMRVTFSGKEYTRLNSLEEIQAWWKKRCYKDEDPKNPNTLEDPLQQTL